MQTSQLPIEIHRRESFKRFRKVGDKLHTLHPKISIPKLKYAGLILFYAHKSNEK